MNSNWNLWLIPALPLAGCALNGLFGRRFPRQLVTMVALAASGAAFVWALVVAARLAATPAAEIPHLEVYGTWLRAGSLSVPFAFMVDQLTLIMLLVVTGVGFLIHIYSAGYMAHEGGYYRFFSYLNLFMFFMLTLVLANNYLLMFVGWEGVGLASYLLIGFYFVKDSAASAGKKAFLVIEEPCEEQSSKRYQQRDSSKDKFFAVLYLRCRSLFRMNADNRTQEVIEALVAPDCLRPADPAAYN